MVPDYISEKIMKQQKISKKGEEGDCYPCMGCRSFLTPYRDPATKKPKYYGRFNQGVVSINLPDVALSSKGDMEKFWYILEERLELCHRALRLRHEHLRGVKSDVAPILWQNGAFARLKKGETIDKLLYNGYSTISLGYAGLYECVKYMTGKSHTEDDGREFGLEVMKKLNDKCKAWKQVEKIDYSVYGTPIENTTEKFAKCLQARFGKVEGITDRNYITNSYHVPVFEKIDAFEKINKEAEFQKLSPGGAISYIETPNMVNNVEAVLAVIKHIYDNIMYAELNTKLDTCQKCGFQGEIEMIKDENGKLIWKCPNCGNTEAGTMNIIRRVCGYLSNANEMCQGRLGDIRDRVLHL
jgi:ribonucleoside-triphosphate reductase